MDRVGKSALLLIAISPLTLIEESVVKDRRERAANKVQPRSLGQHSAVQLHLRTIHGPT